MPPDAWQQLAEHVHLVPGSVNSVVLHGPDGAILIDSGANADAGTKLVRGLRERGWPLVAVLTSHAHADHFGGHAAVVKRMPAPVYAPPVEAELMRAPVLEPIYLFHGAAPLPELTGRWLQAPASPVDVIVDAGQLRLAGLALELLDVSGHAHRQLAVRVDDVLIAADGVFGPEVITKYPMLFSHDAGAQREAALRVGDVGARLVIPGHGAPGAGVDLAEATVAAIDRVTEAVVAAADGVPATTVLARVAAALGVTMDDLPRYHLNHTTVMAYLASLRAAGRVRAELARAELRWHAG